MTRLSDDETIDLMARLLRCKKTDLGNEADVLRTLNSDSRFLAGEVMTLHERAIERAHLQNIEFGDIQ